MGDFARLVVSIAAKLSELVASANNIFSGVSHTFEIVVGVYYTDPELYHIEANGKREKISSERYCPIGSWKPTADKLLARIIPTKMTIEQFTKTPHLVIRYLKIVPDYHVGIEDDDLRISYLRTGALIDDSAERDRLQAIRVSVERKIACELPDLNDSYFSPL